MAKRQQQQDDPWSGFVDVLSNVVMVVTFIVIILGIAMFALSQQIAEGIAKKIIEAKCKVPGEDPPDVAALVAHVLKKDEAQPADAVAPPAAAASPSRDVSGDAAKVAGNTFTPGDESATEEEGEKAGGPDSVKVDEGDEKSEGLFRVTRGRPELLEDEIEGRQDLTVRARPTEERKEIDSVVSEERVDRASGKVRDARDALAVINFNSASFDLTDDAESALKTALDGAELSPDMKFEVRAIALSQIGSISEARRLGFYRAMNVRSALIRAGVKPENITTRMRESGSQKDLNNVYLFLKE